MSPAPFPSLDPSDEEKLASLDYFEHPGDTDIPEYVLNTTYDYDDGNTEGVPSRAVTHLDDGRVIVTVFRIAVSGPEDEESLEQTPAMYESLEDFYMSEFGTPVHPRDTCAWCAHLPGRYLLTSTEIGVPNQMVCGPDCHSRPGPISMWNHTGRTWDPAAERAASDNPEGAPF